MFMCKICNKDFKQASNLKSHENKKNRCGGPCGGIKIMLSIIFIKKPLAF